MVYPRLYFQSADHLMSMGDVVIDAENIQKAFDEKVLIESLSFQLPAGGIVGIIGPNGAGKTTLFNDICNSFTHCHSS